MISTEEYNELEEVQYCQHCDHDSQIFYDDYCYECFLELNFIESDR